MLTSSMACSDSNRPAKSFINTIQCFMCTKVYSSPRLLPCMHTFCLPCLERHGIEKKPGDTVFCPLCLHEFRLSSRGFIGLPRNIFVEELAEVDKMAKQAMLDTQCDACFESVTSGRQQMIQTASVHCNDCTSNLCTECCRQSRDNRACRHTVIDLSQYLQRLYKRDLTYCELHPEEAVGLYCFDCRITLCTSCNIDGGHRVHKCAGVERAACEFQHRLEEDTRRIVDRSNRCREIMKTVGLEREQFTNKVRQVQSEIQQKGEEMKKLIDCQVNELLAELADIQTKTLDKLDSVQSELDRFLRITDSFVLYTEALTEHGTPLDISRSGHDLVARAAKLQSLPFIASGADYRTPLVTYKPWYDLISLLTNNESNIVGSLTTVMKTDDGNPSFSYFLKPSSIKTVHQEAKAIIGVAAMSGHVIIVRVEAAEIELYSAVTWSLQRRLAVPGLQSPTDLVASDEQNRVFISDYTSSCIHYSDLENAQSHSGVNASCQSLNCSSVDVIITNGGSNGGIVRRSSHVEADESNATQWPMEDKPWSLSLSQKGDSLVVVCDQVRKLYEYTLHGSILRQVCLTSDLVNPRHAILLSTDHFVVSFSEFICLIDADGKRCNQTRQTNNSTVSTGRINVSGRLAFDNKSHVIVLDVEAKRILQLGADNLEFIREIVPSDDKLRYTARLCVDSLRDRMYVADNELTVKSRLTIKSKFWGKSGRLVIYETKSTY